MTNDRKTERPPQGGAAPEDKVAFLSSPDAYGAGVSEVSVIETHMSWVFLAGDRVYKLKRPVHYPFLDFRTLDAREADCRAEVRLNRRLAPHVYLGVLPLVAGGEGGLAVGGEGTPVDWLVEMRRLPAERMLDAAIVRGTVTRPEIDAVADLLSRFYAAAEPAQMAPEEYVAHLAAEHATNRAVLSDPDLGLPQPKVRPVLDALDAVLEGEPDLLGGRAKAGRLVDGHGDLRPEHVCLIEPPVIIDCLEFNRRLRLVDPVDELAFLAMECERLEAPWIGAVLLARYAATTGDRPSARLVAFHAAYRACLRARLSLAHLQEPDMRERDRWLPQAREYLALAERALNLAPRQARPASRPRGSGG